MAEPFPPGPFVRIIYQRGLQLVRQEEHWIIPSSERLEAVEVPGEFERAWELLPIICDTAFNVPFFQPRRLLNPKGQPVSRARYLKGYVEDPERRIYKYLVEHHLWCGVAHLGYLAEAYGGLAVLHNENRWSLPEHVLHESKTQLFDSALRHAEAVFASLCSAFEASRFLVYRDDIRAPATLTDTMDLVLATADEESRPLIEPIRDVWYEEGPRLLQYRDCSVNHHPVTALGGRCGGFLNDGDHWEMRIDLPDNPEARRRDQFTFDEEIDLLEYCWEVTCRVTRTMERALPPIFQRATLMRPESRWSWLTEG